MKFVLCVCLILYFCDSTFAQQPWFNWREWIGSVTSNPNTGSIGKQGIKGPDESKEPKPNNNPGRPNWRRRPRPVRPQYPEIDVQAEVGVEERLIFNKKKDKEKEVVVEKPKKKGGYKRKGCRSVHPGPENEDHEHYEEDHEDHQAHNHHDDHGEHHDVKRSAATSLPNEPIPRANTINPTI